LLLYKEFFMREMNWSVVMIKFTYFQTVISLLLLAGACLFFYQSAVRLKKKKLAVVPEEVPAIQ